MSQHTDEYGTTYFKRIVTLYDGTLDSFVSKKINCSSLKVNGVDVTGSGDNTATSSNDTPNTIVSRDSSGNFSASNITANLIGNSTTATSFTGNLNGQVTGGMSTTVISPGIIADAHISNSAEISNSKLKPLTLAGMVADSATTATPLANPSTIAERDSTGQSAFTTVVSPTGIMNTIDTPPAGNTVLNLGTVNATTVNLGTATTTQVVNIGTGSGYTVINLGGAGDAVNIVGTLTYVTLESNTVSGATLILNTGGAAASGGGAGVFVDEAGAVAAYVKVDGSRGSWLIKAPSTNGVVTFTPGAGGFTINQGSHNPVTINATPNGLTVDGNQVITLVTASGANTGALTNTDWTTFSNSATAVTAGLAGAVNGQLGTNTLSANYITNTHINSAAAIADSKLATITTAGKVANSATSATSSNVDGTIVLRNNSSGTNFGGPVFSGNIILNQGPNTYHYIQTVGGNANGYWWAYHPLLSNAINMSFNFFYDPNGNTVINNAGGGTSNISLTYGNINLMIGATNTAPTVLARVNSSGITMSSGSFNGPLVGSSAIVTSASANAVSLLTGSNTTSGNYGIGRVSAEGGLGVSGASDSLLTGSLAGDIVLGVNDSTKKVRIGAGMTNGKSAGLVVSSADAALAAACGGNMSVAGTLSVTGTSTVNNLNLNAGSTLTSPTIEATTSLRTNTISPTLAAPTATLNITSGSNSVNFNSCNILNANLQSSSNYVCSNAVRQQYYSNIPLTPMTCSATASSTTYKPIPIDGTGFVSGFSGLQYVTWSTRIIAVGPVLSVGFALAINNSSGIVSGSLFPPVEIDNSTEVFLTFTYPVTTTATSDKIYLVYGTSSSSLSFQCNALSLISVPSW